MRRFYLCRAKCGYSHCGYYYASKLWKKQGKFWYCKADWQRVFKEGEDAQGFDGLRAAYGEDTSRWPSIGCGAKFAPWRRGESIILEWRTGVVAGTPTYEAMLADLMPELLDVEVKRDQAATVAKTRKETPVHDLPGPPP